MLPDGSSLEATPPESSLSTDIIVLEALLEAERDGVAAMNEVTFILRLEITKLEARIMQATQESICGSSAPSMLPNGSSSEATPPESSLSTYIIVLEALLEAERDGVAAMNEVISILKLEIMQLAARIMQATQELEEVRMLHLKTEEVLLLLLSEAQGNPSSSLDSS